MIVQVDLNGQIILPLWVPFVVKDEMTIGKLNASRSKRQVVREEPYQAIL